MQTKYKLLINTIITGVNLFNFPSNQQEKEPTVIAYSDTFQNDTIQTYTVKTGDNLYHIALTHNCSLDSLKSLNNQTDNLIHPGDILKIPPKEKGTQPNTKKNSYRKGQSYGQELTEEQYITLLEVVQQESGGHDYDAVLAVMSVITNRVDSDWHPNTVWSVITAKGQFEAYGAGHYKRHRGKVTDITKQAVRDGLNGKKNVSVLNFWSDWYYKKQGRNDEEAINIGGNVFFNL